MPAISFRLDAGAEMGGGHLMRCAALAHEMTARGWTTTICGSAETVALAEHQPAFQHRITLSPEALADAAALPATDLIVIDHPGLDTGYQQALRRRGLMTLVFSDHPGSVLDCDILLDQNIGRRAEDYTGLVPPAANCLCGTDYALLRPAYLAHPRSDVSPSRARARNILVTFGASDPTDATGQLLRSLHGRTPSDWRIKVVIGPSYRHQARLTDTVAGWDAVELLHAPPDLAGPMRWADIGVTAAGSTCWEMCRMGLPFIVINLGESPNANADRLQALDAAIHAGSVDAISDGRFFTALNMLMEREDLRRNLARNAARLVDGDGAKRVCNVIGQRIC